MTLDSHTFYILSAYASTLIVLGGLIVQASVQARIDRKRLQRAEVQFSRATRK